MFSIIKCDFFFFFLGLFADVTFELDDGSVPAHKAILTARCDVMKAMFSGDFRESSAKVVSTSSFLKVILKIILFLVAICNKIH